MTNSAEHVQQILDGFQHNHLSYNDYLQSQPSASDEAAVRQKIVEPLLAALGYDLQADLVPEHRRGANAIDILVEAGGVPVMLWELKRTQETDLTRFEDQLTRYVLTAGVTHAVLCNGREVRVYQRVGDALHFSYAFPLEAFASGAIPQPSPHDEQALRAFFDAFNKDAFQEIERQKQEIVVTTTPPLRLTPDQPQNETILIERLTREIERLHRFVVLRFRSHRRRHREFLAEKAQKEARATEERESLRQRLETFAEQARLDVDWPAVVAYLDAFAGRWTDIDEREFIAQALERTGVAIHLNGARRSNIENRLRAFYRAFTDHARWHAERRVKLRPIRALMEDFEHWREEIGVMAEDPAAEFCLQTVYIFVTRLLLIRICEDKELITQKIADGGYKTYLNFSDSFFTYITDVHGILLDLAYKDTSYIYGHFFSQDVFDWYTWEEEAIVRLFWTLHRFDFTDVSADLIGRIYEQYVDELERRRKGQFYTPPQVVNYILDQVGYDGPGIVGQRLLDPACGSGRFLVEAARRLVDVLQHQTELEPKELVNERLRDSLFGMDINRFACFLAEVNLLVQVLDLLKGGPTFTIERFHIYPTNTLLPREQATELLVGPGNGIAYESEVAELIKARGYNPALGGNGRHSLDFRPGFDYVVGNPPYVRADNPGVGQLRSRIEASERYKTLYKKWDLYIPFIEFAVQMLAEGGHHGFIVSDAYQTEEYGTRSRQFLLDETTIESLTFAPKVSFFEEAQVHNLIYAVRRGAPPDDHQVERYKAVAPMLRPQELKTLPALSQAEWGEQIFRLAFKGEDGLDFSDCIELGEICYINTGLELQSHEKYDPVVDGIQRKLFVKDDLLSSHRTETHIKPYVEADDMGRYVLEQIRWLEWGTSRVPSKLRRSRFPELFENQKVMVAIGGNSFYDGEGSYYNQANSVSNCVLYHKFQSADVKEYVARVMARMITDEEIEALGLTPAELSRLSKSDLAEKIIEKRAQVSPEYDLRYITALFNCRWLRSYMMAFVRRGSRRRFYPDDLKQWPIAQADAATQSQIARLVDEIMSAKADVQRWRDAGHQIDEDGVLLNPRPYLDTWGVNHGDLIDASGFLSHQIGGHITTIRREGQRVEFRQIPPSYVESQHDQVLDYVALYLETNREALDAVPAAHMAREIRIPRSPNEVQRFLDRLADERERVMLRWMVAAQHENLIDEWAFELYDVVDDRREELGGTLYTLDGVPDGVDFVSILDDADDSPMRRVAFRWDGAWHYRTEESLPNAVLIWMHDGQQVTSKHGVVGVDGSIAVT